MQARGEKINTKIYLGLILMKQNESEKQKFFQLSDELGVDGSRIEVPAVRTINQGKFFLPDDKKYWIYDIDYFNKGLLIHKGYKANYCKWIYYSITVTRQGDIVPCCRDVNGEYIMGNLLRDDFSAIWNSTKFIQFREKILKDTSPLPMCLLCDGLTFPSLEVV